MLRLSALIWIMSATTLAGILVVVVLVVPELAEQDAKFIPIAVIIGALTAMPISYLIAKKVMA